VEVRIDDGPWQAAVLERKPERGDKARYTWTFWHLDWIQPAPGDHTVVSRATDADGRVQPSIDSPDIQKKITYWEANQQWTRKIRID
jgi:hypothetical protein